MEIIGGLHSGGFEAAQEHVRAGKLDPQSMRCVPGPVLQAGAYFSRPSHAQSEMGFTDKGSAHQVALNGEPWRPAVPLHLPLGCSASSSRAAKHAGVRCVPKSAACVLPCSDVGLCCWACF